MEINNLPLDIQNKIFYFLEHPTAAIVKESFAFMNIKYRERRVHGDPFCRGSCDRYYHRRYEPHYWTNGNGRDGGTIPIEKMTEQEILEYRVGYFMETNRKI